MLPPSLLRHFHDIDPRDLAAGSHPEFVVRRLLAAGDWGAARWLLDGVGEEAVLRELRRSRGRAVPRRWLRLWQLLLDVPEDEVCAWLDEAAALPWEGR
jgi:hypothetical protein